MFNSHDTPAFTETPSGDIIVPPDAIDKFGWQPELPLRDYEYPMRGPESSLRIAARAALGQQLNSVEELTNPSIVERLTTIHEQLGFYPTSLNELSRSHMILGFRGTAGGAAKHVAEVVTHQSKDSVNTDDPLAAARSLTSTFAAYARRARTDKAALMELQKELSQSTASPLSGVDAIAVTGRGQLARYLDLLQLAEKGKGGEVLADSTVKAGSDHYIAGSPDSHMRAHISAVLSSKRLGETRQGLPAVIKEQTARQTFWMQCLMDIAQHYPVLRTQAIEAIRSLNPNIAADD